MAKLPDIERSIAKIHAAASVEDNVVMFDDTNKRKVLEFVRVVKGLQMSLEIMETLQRAMEEAETTFPPSLQKLVCTAPNDSHSSGIADLNLLLRHSLC